MPLTSAASAHSPRRMCISAWLMPNALISMTTWPALRLRLRNVLVDEAVEAAEFLKNDGTHGSCSEVGGRGANRTGGRQVSSSIRK